MLLFIVNKRKDNVNRYLPRIADKVLDEQLSVIGAVLIEGAKWCGKTRTAKEHANSTLLMDDPESMNQNILLAKSSPSIALSGKTPRLIDEWQLAASLWDAVRFEVDKRGEPGQFILTGSATPPDMSEVHHSGIGRISHLLMRPMSLFESEESTGEVSLAELFEAPTTISGQSDHDIMNIAYLTCRGGWPSALGVPGDSALKLAEIYYKGLVEDDISKSDNVSRNKNTTERIMRSYARNQGEQVSLEYIKSDVEAGDSITISKDTIRSYVEALRNIYIIEDAPSWSPNLRSKTAIRTSDTRYFVDPSIATAALGLGPEDLINDLNTFGFIFETLCMRDLRVYADAIGATVSHYRDSNGLECDAVIHLKNGKYGLIQIKLAATEETIGQASEKLNRLSTLIDDSTTGSPAFRMIITGTGTYAYRQEDGIYVVPIGCLKP